MACKDQLVLFISIFTDQDDIVRDKISKRNALAIGYSGIQFSVAILFIFLALPSYGE